jgi:hypothetical protein
MRAAAMRYGIYNWRDGQSGPNSDVEGSIGEFGPLCGPNSDVEGSIREFGPDTAVGDNGILPAAQIAQHNHALTRRVANDREIVYWNHTQGHQRQAGILEIYKL